MHEGAFAQITCLVPEGDLPIEITWTLNGAHVDEFGEIVVTKVGKRTSLLTLEAVSHSIAGNFSCWATNLAAGDSFTTELQVNGYNPHLTIA